MSVSTFVTVSFCHRPMERKAFSKKAKTAKKGQKVQKCNVWICPSTSFTKQKYMYVQLLTSADPLKRPKNLNEIVSSNLYNIFNLGILNGSRRKMSFCLCLMFLTAVEMVVIGLPQNVF